MKVITIVPAIYNVIIHVFSSIGSEARLAGRSIMVLLALAILLGSIFATIWLCVLAMLFVYLSSLQWNPLWSLLLIIGINLVFLIIVLYIMSKAKNNLTFHKTRQQFTSLAEFCDDC